MKKKNIAISFLLLLVAAGIWYYVSLPAFNIHSSGVWYFVLVLVLAVGLVLAGKKGLRYGAIDLKEMKESKGFKWCVRLFILLLVIYLAGTILSSPIVNANKSHIGLVTVYRSYSRVHPYIIINRQIIISVCCLQTIFLAEYTVKIPML